MGNHLLVGFLWGVQYVVFGFGYDDAKDDYKVVRMVQFYGKGEESFRSEVSVYSLKLDSWRKISDFPYYLSYERVSSVLANGALHWVVSRKRRWGDRTSGDLITTFDIRTEEYRLVPQPEYSIKDFYMNMDVLEGCLCMLFKNYSFEFEMWVMEDYGAKMDPQPLNYECTKNLGIRQKDGRQKPQPNA
ncbi:hypothetical protein LguiA_013167 [Lonicera macranthoides]